MQTLVQTETGIEGPGQIGHSDPVELRLVEADRDLRKSKSPTGGGSGGTGSRAWIRSWSAEEAGVVDRSAGGDGSDGQGGLGGRLVGLGLGFPSHR